MRALSLALLCLGSVSFLGLEAAKPDLASDFKRRWSKWEQQQQQQRRRARRELPSAVPGGGAPEAEGPLLPSSPSKAFVRPPQEAKGEPRSPEEEEASEASAGHVRVKRYQYHQYHQYQYRPAAPALSQMHSVRTGCRLGTCNTANLAHIIFHLTDKDKDSTPPANKLSPHGYGRRRRKRRRRRRR